MDNLDFKLNYLVRGPVTLNENKSLYEIAQRLGSTDHVTKPLFYYQKYDQALASKNLVPKTMLEIGVHRGESTKVFATRYSELAIVAADIQIFDIDFSEFPSVTYIRADQSDCREMQSLCEKFFPHGVDLVIDDASHIGALSKLTFEAVFPHVRQGGLYIIEDWGTGYWKDWPDGAQYREAIYVKRLPFAKRRLRSHDYGMVGFIKSLVDLAGAQDILRTKVNPPLNGYRVRSVEVSPSICIVEKA